MYEFFRDIVENTAYLDIGNLLVERMVIYLYERYLQVTKRLESTERELLVFYSMVIALLKSLEEITSFKGAERVCAGFIVIGTALYLYLVRSIINEAKEIESILKALYTNNFGDPMVEERRIYTELLVIILYGILLAIVAFLW